MRWLSLADIVMSMPSQSCHLAVNSSLCKMVKCGQLVKRIESNSIETPKARRMVCMYKWRMPSDGRS